MSDSNVPQKNHPKLTAKEFNALSVPQKLSFLRKIFRQSQSEQEQVIHDHQIKPRF